MANTVIGVGFLANIGAGLTRYLPLAAGAVAGAMTTESNTQTSNRSRCIIQNLNFFIFSNSLDTGSITLTVRKNSANSSITCSIPAGITGVITNDLTHHEIVEVGDVINLSVVTGGTTGVLGAGYNIECVNLSGTTGRYGCGCPGTTVTTTTASQTSYLASSGVAYLELTAESNVQNYVNTAGTWKNGQIRVVTNSRTTSTTLVSRINGVTGNMSITIPAGSTGVFSDFVHTDTLNPGDKFNWMQTTGTGAGTFAWTLVTSEIGYAGSSSDIFWMAGSGGDPISSTGSLNTLLRWALARGIQGQENFHTSRAATCWFPFRLSKFGVNVTANTLGAAMPVNNRNEGVAGGVGVTINPGATGWILDTSGNTDQYLAPNRFSWEFDNRATTILSGSITTQAMTFQMTDTWIPPTITGLSSIQGVSSISF